MQVEIDNRAYPYTAVVFIETTFPNGTHVTGSGVVVGRNDILTASHVVYDGNAGGAASSIRVTPGYDPDPLDRPYGVFEAARWNYFSDFDPDLDGKLVDGNNGPALVGSEIDIAMIGLSEPISHLTGSMGIDGNFSSGFVNLTGYPGIHGTNPRNDFGSAFRDSDDHLIRFPALESYPGNSGGPIWYDSGSGPRVVGIVSTGLWGAAISGPNFNQVIAWISENDDLIREPEVRVTGNGSDIVDGDSTPTGGDHTDFGQVSQGGSGLTRVFTVSNPGSALLTTSALNVPLGFTLVDGLASSIAAGGSDTFSVRLDTASLGTKSGQISFNTNDADEATFNFSVTGVVATPEVALSGNGVNIADGDSSPTSGDHTDFGSVLQDGSGVTRIFTVSNSGTGALNTSGLTLPGGYSLLEALSASIAPGASDTFTVRLNSLEPGTKSGQISFENDDASENPFNFSIAGTVIATFPEVAVSGNAVNIADGDATPGLADHTDFGQVTQDGSGQVRVFTVSNIGTRALTLSALTLPGGYSLLEGLSPSIAPGTSDTFTVRLNALTLGTKSGQISFTSNDADEATFNFSIAGVVAIPEVAVSGNAVNIADGDSSPTSTDHTDFGTVLQNGSGVTRVFAVSNSGTGALNTSGLTLPGGYSLLEGLSPSIAPGAFDTFTVRLNALDPGTKSGQISFANDDASENPFNFSIAGTVIATFPEVAVSGNGVNIADGDGTPASADHTDFGAVMPDSSGLTRVFTVSNSGTGTLTPTGLTIPQGYSLLEGLSAAIAAGASDTFTVRLNALTLGPKSGQISFTSNDADEATFNFSIAGVVGIPEVAVSGNGVNIADGDSTPASTDHTDFGAVMPDSSGLARVFTVSNSGTGTLTPTGLTIPEGYSLLEGLSAAIAAGASDTFTVRLNALTVGPKSGQIIFTSNDADEATFNFSVAGEVGVPEVAISANGVGIADGDSTPTSADHTDFGPTNLGGSGLARIFTVSNTATGTLHTSGLTIPEGYSVLEGLSSAIAPGTSDTFTVRLNALTLGPKSGQISFTSNDADETTFNFSIAGVVGVPEVAVIGNGVNIADGDGTPTSADHSDFGPTNLGGSGMTRIFTVTNTGTGILGTSGLTLPAGYSLLEGLSGSFAPGASDTFTVRLNALEVGTKSGQISFTSNDADETTFNFSIAGVVGVPEVAVSGNGVNIANGDSAPESADHTDFGPTNLGGSGLTRIFTVTNTGTGILGTSGLTLPAGYSLLEGLSGSFAPGASDTFTVRLNALEVGTKSGQISFTSNDADETTFNFSIAGVVGGPEVAVIGNGVNIADGDSAPENGDHTDFGAVTQHSSGLTRVFTVSNTGIGALTPTGLTIPEGYSLLEGLSAVISAGASDTFSVRLNALVAGTKDGTVSFTSNDADESPFNFSITGTVIAAIPEVAVSGNGVNIADGDSAPENGDHTDFGAVMQHGSGLTRVFTVSNTGIGALTPTGLTIPEGYSLLEGLSAVISAGASDTFSVRLNALVAGTKDGTVSFTSNDADESPFNFSITGIVIAAIPEVAVIGNGVNIADGDSAPENGDHTDFGAVMQHGSGLTRVFTVSNTGIGALTPTGLTIPEGYSLLEGLSAVISAGDSDSFSVRLNALVAGTKDGTISFTSNDADESPFNFSITGTVIATVPMFAPSSSGMSVAAGETLPNARPVVTATNRTLSARQPVPASTLFSVTDAENDLITAFGFVDSDAGVDSGYFSIDGIRQSQTTDIVIPAPQLANLTWVAGIGASSDSFLVRAADAGGFGAWAAGNLAAI